LVTYDDNELVLAYDSGSSTWALAQSDGSIETYNSAGRPISIADRNGVAITLQYDTNPMPRLMKAIDHAGREVEFGYYGNTSRILWMEDPADERTSYAYDAQDRLKTVTYPDSSVRTYHYWGETAEGGNTSFPRALTGITDEEGNRIATWTYDSSGRATSSAHGDDVDHTDIDYSNAPGEVVVTNALGRETTLTLAYENGLARVSEIEGAATALCGATTSSITYSSSGYIDERTDENGSTVKYTYNDRGLLEDRVDAYGTSEARTVSTEWHSTYSVPDEITRDGQVVDLEYDTSGRITSRTVQSE
jgi:YD repeat-containing protein